LRQDYGKAPCSHSGRTAIRPTVEWEQSAPQGALSLSDTGNRFLETSMTDTTSLKDRITEDMKSAMRARESARLSAIRLLQAAIKQKEVDERIVVDDTAVLAIVEKLIKQRKDSIEQFARAGRTDLVDKETAELTLLTGYLPQQFSEGEVVAVIDVAIAEVGMSGPQAMGKVMALVKPRLAGRADMSRVSGLVKQRLG
jgi:uncharacterized protein